MADMGTDVKLSMMRALWEQVSADLRGVAVAWRGWSNDGSVAARFLCEAEIGEQQTEWVLLRWEG